MIKTILHLDDKKYNVLEWFYSFTQNSDSNGRPSNKPRLTKVSILIEAKDVVEFLLWATHPTLQKQLMLQIMPRILGSKSRKIYLVDCNCVNYNEEFDATSKTPQTLRLELTCGGLEESDTSFSETWRKTYPNTATSTVLNQEEEKEILESYYEDMQGNRIESPKVGTEVYLIIKTEGLEGKTIDIDLSDKEKNFVYKGAILENDILKNIIIKSSIQKEKLTVIAENH